MDVVTADLAGSLSYDYLPPNAPASIGAYRVDALGLADAVLASASFDLAKGVW